MWVGKGLMFGLAAPLVAAFVSVLSPVTAESAAATSVSSQWPWAQARPAAAVTGGHGLPTPGTRADGSNPNDWD